MKTKRLFSTMLCIALMALVSVNVQAQNRDKQRLSREELAIKQAKHIAVELSLDDATTKRFVETYGRCQQEIWQARGPKRAGKFKSSNNETEEELKQDFQASFERSRKLLDIREKYYKEFSQFLTQKQIMDVYKEENVMKMRLTMRKKKSMKK